MMEAINPLYWWGAVAIAAPIIIHLINRLRYRRVRWAAMEFLLKSQQRNRRKLILEQLLLLAMRCLLVMMAVMLVVRPTGCLEQADAGAENWPTYHVFLLDDSLSMQDLENPRLADPPTAFHAGSRLVGELAKKLAEAPNTHYLTLLKWSDVSTPEFGKPVDQLGGAAPGQQLTSDEVQKLREKLDALRCTYLPLHPLGVVQQATRYFDNIKEGHKVLHIVSDFRRGDWTETDADELCQLLAELAKGSKVQVRLHDMALPRRGSVATEVPRAHANLGIVNLVARPRPRSDAGDAQEVTNAPLRIVTPGLPVYLYATVHNFSDGERLGQQLTLKIDGVERQTRQLERIPGGEDRTVVFDLSFGPEEELGLKQVAVTIEDPEKQDHLVADNSRFTYLDLRKEVPVLLIDPDYRVREGDAPPDSYFIANALTGTARSGLRPERLHPRDLKSDEVRIVDPRDNRETRRKLDQYAVIFLLNIPGVGDGAWDLDPVGVKVLENYLARGGSIVFFLGPRTNVISFNKDLYKNGQGIFPAPLSPRPEPEKREQQPFVDDPPDESDHSPKVRFLQANHPALPFKGELAKVLSEYIAINRYFKVDPVWKAPEGVRTVIQVANRQPLVAYRRDAIDLADALRTGGGASGPKLTEYADRIAGWVADAEVKRAQKGPLIEAVGGVLSDPALAEFWQDSARQDLRRRLERFLDVIQTGDPLLLEATYNKGKSPGHIMAFLTPAAPTIIGKGKDYTWNNWANEMAFTYVPMVLSLHDYLARLSRASSEIETNREIGTDVEIRLPKERYMPNVELWHQREGDPNPVRVDQIAAREEQGELMARLRAVRGPGHYRLKLNQPTTEGNPETAFQTARGDPEEWPLVFNVNGRMEGLLARVSESELQDRFAAGLQKGQLRLALDESLAFVQSRPWFIRNPLEETSLGESRQRSWSDYSWVLLAFLGVLLLEQFLAMLFSHHLESGIAQAPPQASRGRSTIAA